MVSLVHGGNLLSLCGAEVSGSCDTSCDTVKVVQRVIAATKKSSGPCF